MLEHVVKDQHAIGSHTRQEELVIEVVAGFVGINEGKIELSPGRKRFQLSLPTPQAQLYLLGHSC
jgi:hypothetical protein